MKNYRENNNPEDEKLSAMLDSKQSQAMRNLMQSMPEETVSLQWRSALNERLLSLAPTKKKLSAAMVGLRALVGVALASAVCLVVFVKSDSGKKAAISVVDPSTFASALISEHRQSVVSSEIAGPGIVDGETEKTATQDSDNDDPDTDSL
ncbi:MAG TPA: hypothetical protein VGL56_15385 [Fimbriimonadaceae bacterium]